MEERVYEIEMIFIQNKAGKDFRIELIGRHKSSVILNYTDVEGIEVQANSATEIKHSYVQMAEGAEKIWNMKFVYPAKVVIKYMGKIIIDVN